MDMNPKIADLAERDSIFSEKSSARRQKSMKSSYAALTRYHGVEAKIFVRPAASEKEEVIHPNTTISKGEPQADSPQEGEGIQERWELSELQREGDLPEEPTTETDPNNLSVISNYCVFESLPLVLYFPKITILIGTQWEN